MFDSLLKTISSFISTDSREDDENLLKQTGTTHSDKTLSSEFLKAKNSKNYEEKDENNFLDLYDLNSKPYTEKEWTMILNSNNDNLTHNNDKLLYSLRKGIPHKLRGKIWIYLAEAQKTAIEHDIDIFKKLLEFEDEEVSNLINKDIDRTILTQYKKSTSEVLILDHERKKNLYSVLKAYASYDNEVRYCQGTNFIVAILLSNINSKRYTFWTFVNIMNKNKWRDLFTKNTPKLLRMIDILQNCIKRNLPRLYNHFANESFLEEFAAVFSQFFFTIFSYGVPIEYSFRVMDLFFVLEEKIIFECILKLLTLQQEKLLTMDLEAMFHYIRSNLVKDCIREYGVEESLPDTIFNTKFR